jgi:hypothetical protein
MDLDSGNLVGSYLTLDEAFAVIQATYVLNGWTSVNDLGLVRVTDNGSQEAIATGSELARRAIWADDSDADCERSKRTA